MFTLNVIQTNQMIIELNNGIKPIKLHINAMKTNVFVWYDYKMCIVWRESNNSWNCVVT